MTTRRWILAAGAVAGLAGCMQAPSSRFRSYEGPEVTRLVVQKKARRLYLMHDDQVLRRYRVALGFAPEGHKQQEGDGRTPEGRYRIDRRNPNSAFHLSLGISYPDANDHLRASTKGVLPGSDIFIHGRGRSYNGRPGDWTAGCIAVTDREIEEIYAMVRVGTVIDIYP